MMLGIGHPAPGDLIVGDRLIVIHPDGTVTGEVEHASEAGRVFIDAVRHHLAEPRDLVDARQRIHDALNLVRNWRHYDTNGCLADLHDILNETTKKGTP